MVSARYLWSMETALTAKLPRVRQLLRAHDVEACHLFGSAAKGEFRSDSDYDLLVRFSEKVPLLRYADNYFELLDALQSLLGREVDLVTERSLKNPMVIEEIRTTSVPIL